MHISLTHLHIVIVGTLLLSVLPLSVEAASLSVVHTYAQQHNEAWATVRFDTEGENINTLSGTLVFSPVDGVHAEVVTGNSAVTFWIEQPEEQQPGRIPFAGIIPGGFVGRGTLFSVNLPVSKGNSSDFHIEDARILRNDGLGSAASATARSLYAPPDDPYFDSYRVEDTTPPDVFSITIDSNPALFGGRFFATFLAHDAGSGIAYYEVQEGRSAVPIERRWKRAESPYELRHQGGHSFLFVKAVDNRGNSRVAVLAPTSGWRFPTPPIFLGVLGIIFLLYYFLWRRKI